MAFDWTLSRRKRVDFGTTYKVFCLTHIHFPLSRKSRTYIFHSIGTRGGGDFVKSVVIG